MLFYLNLNITHIFTGTSLFLNSIFISVDGFLFRREKRGNSFTLLISDIRFLACKIKADSLLLPRAPTKSEVQPWLLGRDHFFFFFFSIEGFWMTLHLFWFLIKIFPNTGMDASRLQVNSVLHIPVAV